jgi:hypothetical protein
VPVTDPPEPLPEAVTTPAMRQRQPQRWIILGLLALFACWFAAMQWRQRAGAPVAWERDLPQAEKHARESNQLIFLMLQAPGCPIAAALDRDLFSQRDIREKMAQLTCCRLEVQPTDPIAQRFGFKRNPLMVVVKPGDLRAVGIRPLEGKIQYPELDTVLRESLKNQGKGHSDASGY